MSRGKGIQFYYVAVTSLARASDDLHRDDIVCSDAQPAPRPHHLRPRHSRPALRGGASAWPPLRGDGRGGAAGPIPLWEARRLGLSFLRRKQRIHLLVAQSEMVPDFVH